MPSYLCVGVHVCRHVCYDTLSFVSLYGPTSLCLKVVSGSSVFPYQGPCKVTAIRKWVNSLTQKPVTQPDLPCNLGKPVMISVHSGGCSLLEWSQKTGSFGP